MLATLWAASSLARRIPGVQGKCSGLRVFPFVLLGRNVRPSGPKSERRRDRMSPCRRRPVHPPWHWWEPRCIDRWRSGRCSYLRQPRNRESSLLRGQGMTRQYIRQVKLVIGQAGGEVTDLSQLHIKFTVRNVTVETLKQADIRIYNVGDETAKKIQNEYTRVELHAGYDDNVGLIFQGQVAMVKRGKENATDSYVDVFGQDGDQAYNNAYLNTSLVKGWTPDDYYNAMMTAAKAYDIQPGYRPTFIGNPATRGAACYGMLKDHMREFAETQRCEWNIEDGKLNLVQLHSQV